MALPYHYIHWLIVNRVLNNQAEVVFAYYYCVWYYYDILPYFVKNVFNDAIAYTYVEKKLIQMYLFFEKYIFVGHR